MKRKVESKEPTRTIGVQNVHGGMDLLHTDLALRKRLQDLNPETTLIVSGQGPADDKSVMSVACANEALALVNGGRQDQYGKPERSFEALADVFTGLLKRKLKDDARVTAEDVALLMVGLKITRESNQRKRDNVVDAHGYLFLLAQLAGYQDEGPQPDRLADTPSTD